MRILGGSLRHRDITIPASSGIRPTSSKVRGQVFNICQGGIEEGLALDLFAGSGAMGIEALSRGAQRCIFVDNNHQAIAALRTTLHHLHLESVSTVIPLDVFTALPVLASSSEPFSFVYIDPPYAFIDPVHELLHIIDTTLPLSPGAYVFLETRKKTFTPRTLSTLSLVSHRTSGDSDLWQFAPSHSAVPDDAIMTSPPSACPHTAKILPEASMATSCLVGQRSPSERLRGSPHSS